jgi:hypothetical protein
MDRQSRSTNIIAPGALAVHADGDVGFEKNIREDRAGNWLP